MDLTQQLLALSQIIVIDVVLAGDNAIVVGMVASRVPLAMRLRVIFWGIVGAVALRVLFALVATQLLAIVGLTLAGGILLLWVCWKMYREIRLPAGTPAFAGSVPSAGISDGQKAMTFGAALLQIIVADVSMSLDNVLAVAGAAKGHMVILAVGLVIAVTCMALLSAYVAKMLDRHPWITWIGLLIILSVAIEMIWSGTHQVGCEFVPVSTCREGALSVVRALIL